MQGMHVPRIAIYAKQDEKALPIAGSRNLKSAVNGWALYQQVIPYCAAWLKQNELYWIKQRFSVTSCTLALQ